MTAISKPTSQRNVEAPSRSQPSPKKASSNVQKTRSQPKKMDQARLSQDAGLRPGQPTPNFQSWANPNTAKSAELKQLSGNTMARNAHGGNVKSLQEHLNRSGAKLDVDGKFGPLTQKAVENYQRQNKLAVDGKVGQQTMGALNKSPETAKKPEPAARGPEAAPKPEPAAKAPEPVIKPEPAARAPQAAAKPDPAAKSAQPVQNVNGAQKPDPSAAKAQSGPQLAGEQSKVPNFQSWANNKPDSGAPQKLPPGSYNAAQITPDQLNKLKNSKDPQEALLGRTIERARENYKDLIKNGSQIIANRNAGNGGSPVLTILPPGFDPNKETRIHTHYHGWNSTVADPKSHEHGLTNRIEAIQRKAGPQTVFVLPEAANAKPGANQTSWGNVRSQAETTNQALRDAGVANPGYRVVSAHSAGGQALQQSIDRDPKGRGLQVDRLELLDSNYGSESSIAGWAGTESGRKVRSVNYFHASNSRSDEGLRRAFGNRYHRVNLGGHAHSLANTLIDTVPDT